MTDLVIAGGEHEDVMREDGYSLVPACGWFFYLQQRELDRLRTAGWTRNTDSATLIYLLL